MTYLFCFPGLKKYLSPQTECKDRSLRGEPQPGCVFLIYDANSLHRRLQLSCDGVMIDVLVRLLNGATSERRLAG